MFVNKFDVPQETSLTQFKRFLLFFYLVFILCLAAWILEAAFFTWETILGMYFDARKGIVNSISQISIKSGPLSYKSITLISSIQAIIQLWLKLMAMNKYKSKQTFYGRYSILPRSPGWSAFPAETVQNIFVGRWNKTTSYYLNSIYSKVM